MENTKDFKPSEKMLAYLDAFLHKDLEDNNKEVCEKANVSEVSVWGWKKNPEYNAWFRSEVDKSLSLYSPIIKKNLMERACAKNADYKLITLALQVIGEYTPTQKVQTEEFINPTVLDEIYQKAKKTIEKTNPHSPTPDSIKNQEVEFGELLLQR